MHKYRSAKDNEYTGTVVLSSEFCEMNRYRQSRFKLQAFVLHYMISIKFYGNGTVHRKSVSINVQQDATVHSLFYP